MHNTHLNHNLQNIECYTILYVSNVVREIYSIVSDEQQRLCTFKFSRQTSRSLSGGRRTQQECRLTPATCG